MFAIKKVNVYKLGNGPIDVQTNLNKQKKQKGIHKRDRKTFTNRKKGIH